jgi:hypothetical protein
MPITDSGACRSVEGTTLDNPKHVGHSLPKQETISNRVLAPEDLDIWEGVWVSLHHRPVFDDLVGLNPEQS